MHSATDVTDVCCFERIAKKEWAMILRRKPSGAVWQEGARRWSLFLFWLLLFGTRRKSIPTKRETGSGPVHAPPHGSTWAGLTATLPDRLL